MQAVEDFMRSFLREQLDLHRSTLALWAPFYAKFYTEDHRDRRDQDYLLQNPETLKSVTKSETSAVAITNGFRHRDSGFRYRYRLESSGDSWRIRGRETECKVCDSTGRHGDATPDSAKEKVG